MEISNKTLAWFVIGAIVVSLIGSIFSLTSTGSITGYAIGDTTNDTGEAKVEVSQAIVLRYVVNSTDFGGGAIDTENGATNCTLATDDLTTTVIKTGCNGFSDTNSGPLTLENVGTSYLAVTLNFSDNASTFIGGNQSVARLQFKVDNLEPGSCTGSIPFPTWTEIGTPNTTVVACTNLSWSTPSNSLRVGINMTIPTDVVSGQRNISIVAQGTSI